MKSFFKSGYIMVTVLTMIPLIRWLMMMPLAFRFNNFYNSMTSLGQIASLSGMVLFSINFILASKFRFLENLFGGLNRVYIAHHLIGGIAFLLLMLHPLFLGFANVLFSIKTTALFFIPGDNWVINLGISALLLLMSLLFITYYLDLPYQLWRLTHKFLGLSFFLGGLHAFFIPSDISRDLILRNYMITIITIALGCYFFRSLFAKYFIKKYRYKVEHITKLPGNVVEIAMMPQGKDIKYLPGQFVFIAFKDKNVISEVHPFSISSSPNDQELKLTVKSLGDFTNSLTGLSPAAEATIEGAYGRFSSVNFPKSNQIWIAGGIGITPFLSMARILINMEHEVRLFYSTKTGDEAVYLDELLDIAAANPKFKVYTIFSATQGRLTVENIEATAGDLKNKEFFICGPPPMMLNLKKQLKARGVVKDKIHTEEFELL